MNKKIVTIIILATIVIGAVAFGGYLLKKKMLSAPISQETIESTNKNTEVVKIAETVVEDTRTYQEKRTKHENSSCYWKSYRSNIVIY